MSRSPRIRMKVREGPNVPLELRRAGLWLGLFVAILAGAVTGAQTSEQNQIDFANGLFLRGYYDLAADAYRKYLDQYPAGAHLEDARYRLAESDYSAGYWS